MLLGTVGTGICPLSFPFQKQVTQERSLVTEELRDNQTLWAGHPATQTPRSSGTKTLEIRAHLLGGFLQLPLSITTQLSLQNS